MKPANAAPKMTQRTMTSAITTLGERMARAA
jgi:hypothetical protein